MQGRNMWIEKEFWISLNQVSETRLLFQVQESLQKGRRRTYAKGSLFDSVAFASILALFSQFTKNYLPEKLALWPIHRQALALAAQPRLNVCKDANSAVLFALSICAVRSVSYQAITKICQVNDQARKGCFVAWSEARGGEMPKQCVLPMCLTTVRTMASNAWIEALGTSKQVAKASTVAFRQRKSQPQTR